LVALFLIFGLTVSCPPALTVFFVDQLFSGNRIAMLSLKLAGILQ
jgi:hypothetical protein